VVWQYWGAFGICGLRPRIAEGRALFAWCVCAFGVMQGCGGGVGERKEGSTHIQIVIVKCGRAAAWGENEEKGPEAEIENQEREQFSGRGWGGPVSA